MGTMVYRRCVDFCLESDFLNWDLAYITSDLITGGQLIKRATTNEKQISDQMDKYLQQLLENHKYVSEDIGSLS